MIFSHLTRKWFSFGPSNSNFRLLNITLITWAECWYSLNIRIRSFLCPLNKEYPITIVVKSFMNLKTARINLKSPYLNILINYLDIFSLKVNFTFINDKLGTSETQYRNKKINQLHQIRRAIKFPVSVNNYNKWYELIITLIFIS